MNLFLNQSLVIWEYNAFVRNFKSEPHGGNIEIKTETCGDKEPRRRIIFLLNHKLRIRIDGIHI